MINVSELAVQVLREHHVHLEPGLTERELSRLERTHGFELNPDHRELLEVALPWGHRWPDWRAADDVVAAALRWPVEGVLAPVASGHFWHPGWGPRPQGVEQARLVARRALGTVPPLVPLVGNRFLPGRPAGRDSPVFSVHQVDVIYFGRSLVDGLRMDLTSVPYEHFTLERGRIDFWSDLAEGVVGPVPAAPWGQDGAQPSER